MHLLTNRKCEKFLPPTHMDRKGEHRMWKGGIIPVGGVMCWQWMLAVVLVCAGIWGKLVEVGPIYVAAGTSQDFCLRGVLHTDEHCFLDGPRLHVNFLMYNVELVGVHWMSCGGAVEVYGGGDFKMFFNPFPQGSAIFPNVRAGAVDVRALVFVDDSCLVGVRIFVFRIAKSCPWGVGALKMYLDAFALA